MGEVRFLEAHEEKAAALAGIMRHQSGKEFSFGERETGGIHVMALTVEEAKGKAHRPG